MTERGTRREKGTRGLMRRLAQYAWVAARAPRHAAHAAATRFRLQAIRRLTRRPLVLFCRPSGIGDIICTFPAALAIRERHPGAYIVYRTRAEFADVVRMGRVADLVLGDDYRASIPVVRDAAFDAVYRPWLEDEKPTGRAHVHLVDDVCSKLGVTATDRQPRLHVAAALSDRIQRRHPALGRVGRMAPVIGIQVGPSWEVREWTSEGWSGLVEALTRELGASVVQLGADVNVGGGKGHVAIRVPGAVDLVGRLTLAETIAAVAACDLFVGIDSGLLHAAGAVGTPCVGVFGPIDPALRLPPTTPSAAIVSDIPCIGCHHRDPRLHWITGCPYNIACMQRIKHADVFTASKALLSRNASI